MPLVIADLMKAAYDNGAGTYVLRPEAAFYDRTDLTYTPVVGDT